MALGTKDLLSLSVEYDSDRSLQLNMLLCLLRVLCSGWWSLSKMVSHLLRVLLSAIVVRHSSLVPTTAPAVLNQPVQSPSIPLLYAASPAHHSIEEDAGNNRLEKHEQEFVADIE